MSPVRSMASAVGCIPMDENHVAWLSVAELVSAYRERRLSPVEVTKTAINRIEEFDGELHAFITRTFDLALKQAAAAEKQYASGQDVAPLAGVPTSIKDAFHLRGVVTTLGSVVYQNQVAKDDSGVVKRVRAAGAVIVGKTNTAEFGQSATTENLLGPDTGNPWDPGRTPGGSSGGAAASVAAGMTTLAVGSDGGGSIRIPAAFTGLFGMKSSSGLIHDEKGFRSMTDFVSAGPLAARVADARIMLGVLADQRYPRADTGRPLRVAYCSRPEGHPVDPDVALAVAGVAKACEDLGHGVDEIDLPLAGWNDIFGPLVLDDEHRERGHLLLTSADDLTSYERSTLRAASTLEPSMVKRAQELLPAFRQRVDDLFERFDVLLTPSTSVPAFPLGKRPRLIDGQTVDWLWGAFPFAVPFNVAGVPAASIPCGLADGMPVGAQLATRAGSDQFLLDVSEQLEEALAFDRTPIVERWRTGRIPAA